MKRTAFVVTVIASLLPGAFAQTQAAKQPDADALLRQVARTYAGAKYFHIEAIEEETSGNELQHSWQKTYLTAISAPGNRFRIETRSGFGSYIQVSDGKTETIYSFDREKYAERPVTPSGPVLPVIMNDGMGTIMQAWRMPQSLESTAAHAKAATLLPDETLTIGGTPFHCYVVHVQNQNKGEDSTEQTFWIDKQTHLIRKSIQRGKSHYLSAADMKPAGSFDFETTMVYPVAELAAHDPDSTFVYTPPAIARKVAKLEPDFPLATANPAPTMVGQMAPDAVFTSKDGSTTALASLKGRPVLLDFWATWCGPCLNAMPQLSALYAQTKDKSLRIVTIDEDQDPQASIDYMARHEYTWINYHDQHGLQKLFKGDGIPLTVLIYAQGKVVYYAYGGKDEQLRAAIAKLGPEYASVAVPHS